MTIRSVTMAANIKYSMPLYLALIATGLVGNYVYFSIVNAHFIFGSIFAMPTLQIFGLSLTIGAAIIAGYTYVLDRE